MENETRGYKFETDFRPLSSEAWISMECLSVGLRADIAVSVFGLWAFVTVKFLVGLLD